VVHKTQRKPKWKGQSGIDNPETLTEFGTLDTEKTEGEETIRNGQPRDTGRIWYTRHRTKINKHKNTTQHIN
jgi:hypothetical protein